MSSSVYVGTAVELTYNGATGATVTASWLDPASNLVLAAVAVTEAPAGSGKFPYTFLVTAPDIWTARFTSSGAQTAVDQYYVRGLPLDGPPPLATVGEIGEEFGSMTAAQEALAEVLLRRASAMVRGMYPDLATRIGAGQLDANLAAQAALNMVLRVMRNPSGLRSKTVGPFTETYDTTQATGLLQLTPAETQLLVAPTSAVASTIMCRPGLAPPPRGLLGRGIGGGW
jgi:hypothetical protein